MHQLPQRRPPGLLPPAVPRPDQALPVTAGIPGHVRHRGVTGQYRSSLRVSPVH